MAWFLPEGLEEALVVFLIQLHVRASIGFREVGVQRSEQIFLRRRVFYHGKSSFLAI